ncbi:MAG: DNA/RNA nuclease SfsA [Pseudomonadota bacterium]
MQFPHPLIEARLVQRYKRFLADVIMPNGKTITVHCPNPGSMAGLTLPGSRVWISDSRNPKRKLRYTLELVEVSGNDTEPTLVGINTQQPNRLAREAIEAGLIAELTGYASLRTEVPYGENSRIDILLEHPDKPPCYVEIKNVHFVRQSNLFEFPDSKTARGAKHLNEMAAMVAAGARAVMLYVVQRADGNALAIAADMDPNYAQAFERATESGVEALAIRCQISENEIIACDMVPVLPKPALQSSQ